MASRCRSACLDLYVFVALLTHLTELTFNALLAYNLYRDITHREVFFALTAGVLIIPLVAMHLFSAIFLLRRCGDSLSSGQAVAMAILHLLQLGIIWRHMALLRERASTIRKNNLKELLMLRLAFTFAAGFPLLLIQLYLVMTSAQLSWSWILYASLVTSLLSTTWAVASFRRSDHSLGLDTLVLSWPGSLFVLLWRTGEIMSRVISLTLFVRLYREWLFLVLGFHWLIMLLCVSIPQACTGIWLGDPLAQKIVCCIASSYAYIFCYVSLGAIPTAVWHTLYYVIMFLENCTLSIVWLTKSAADGFASRYLYVLISTLAFIAAVVCLVVYYKYVHSDNDIFQDSVKPEGHLPKEKQNTCISCDCSQGVSHSQSAGWIKPCHSSLPCGQNQQITQQSLPRLASDLCTLATTVCVHHSGRHCTKENGQACCCKQGGGIKGSYCTSSVAVCCPPQHCVKNCRLESADCVSMLSAVRSSSEKVGRSDIAGPVPWLPSGESQLLTSQLLTPQSHGIQGAQDKLLENYRCLLQQEAQKLCSDGYSTDNTMLEWSKLPITILDTNVWGIQNLDSEACTCCCCCQVTPRDSDISSIFRSSQGAQPCECLGSAGDDIVLDEPTSELCQFHYRGCHRKEPSSDLVVGCACCCHQQPVADIKQSEQINVFTISQGKECCLPQGHGNVAHGQTIRHTAILHKGKHGKKQNQANHSGKVVSETKNEISGRSRDRKSRQHVPSKLQVKAIAEKTKDDERLTKPKLSNILAHSEPIYENVCTMNDRQIDAKVSETHANHSEDPKITSNTANCFTQVRPETEVGLQDEDFTRKDKTVAMSRTEQQEGKGNFADEYSEKESPVKKKRPCKTDSRGRQRPAIQQEHYYVCSESEDSALPPETFGSSLDEGFIASEADSDGSVELVI